MRFSKKFAAIAITAGVALTATAAFAFWTTTGGGTGSATAAAGNGTLTLSAVVAGPAIYPGADRLVTYSADNDGTDAVAVGTVHAVVSTDKAGCTAADFTILDTPSGQNIPADGDPHVLAATGSLHMNNLVGTNQDACKTAAITLTLTSVVAP